MFYLPREFRRENERGNMDFKNFIVIGISHKDFTLEEREEFIKRQPIKLVEKLYAQGMVEGYINLSTCLRVEIYIQLKKDTSLGEFMKNFEEYGVFYKQGYEAVNYLFRVACGFESVIKGEDQILSQIKKSHSESMEKKCGTNILNVIFNKAIELGKKFRHHSKVAHNALSLEAISLKFIKSQVEELKERKILILGLGELSEAIMKLLIKEGVKDITITNRSYHKSIEIQRNYPVEVIGFEEKITAAAEHDIIISATSAPHYIIHRGEFEEVMERERKHIFLDLAVPRDIEETLNELSNIRLFNLDDVWSVYYSNVENRENLMKKYEYLLIEQMSNLKKWFRYRGETA